MREGMGDWREEKGREQEGRGEEERGNGRGRPLTQIPGSTPHPSIPAHVPAIHNIANHRQKTGIFNTLIELCLNQNPTKIKYCF